jgi:hypothetical protein
MYAQYEMHVHTVLTKVEIFICIDSVSTASVVRVHAWWYGVCEHFSNYVCV